MQVKFEQFTVTISNDVKSFKEFDSLVPDTVPLNYKEKLWELYESKLPKKKKESKSKTKPKNWDR